MRTSLGRCQGDRRRLHPPTLCRQQSMLGGLPFSWLHLIMRGPVWPRASRWHSIRVSHLATFVFPPLLPPLVPGSCCHLIIIPVKRVSAIIEFKRFQGFLLFFFIMAQNYYLQFCDKKCNIVFVCFYICLFMYLFLYVPIPFLEFELPSIVIPETYDAQALIC